MCIKTTSQPSSAATSGASGENRRAVTSFHIVAPALTAARATAGFIVSMDTGTSLARRTASMRGTTRKIDLVKLGHGRRAGTRAFAADVQDVGALGDQATRVLDTILRREKLAPVREAVGRDVDDPHHPGPEGGAHGASLTPPPASGRPARSGR